MPPGRQTEARTIRIISQVEGSEDIKKLSDNMSKLNKQTKSLSDSVNFFGSVFSSIFAAQIFGTGITEIIGMSDSMQLLTDRIKTLIPATEDINKTMDKLYTSANSVRAPIEEFAATFARVKVATTEMGLAVDTVILITENLQKTFVQSGASIQSANASTIQFTQGLSSGVLRGEEFNSVMEQNAVLAQVLAKEISGGSVGALREMAREGKLVNTQVLQALIKNSVGLDGNFKQLNVTIAQASTVFRNNLTRAISETSKEMGISSGLSNAILLLGENLQYLGVVIVPIVTAAVFSLVTALRAAYTAGVLFSKSNVIILGLTAMTALVIAAIDNWDSWSTAVKSWGQVVTIYIYKAMLAVEELNLKFAESIGLATDSHYMAVARAVDRINSAEMNYASTMKEREKIAAKTVSIEERQKNALLDLASANGRVVRGYKDTKEMLAEINALYTSGRIGAEEYFDRIGGTRLRMLNKNFQDGKIDLREYTNELNNLSTVDLNKQFSQGQMSVATFMYEEAAIKMRELTVNLQAGKISAIEFNNEIAKLPGNTLSTLDAVNAGVLAYYQGIETYASQVMKATGTIFKSAEDQLVEFAKTGEATWEKFTDVVIDQLLRIMVQLTIIKPLMEAVMGFSPSYTGSIGTNSSMGSTAIMPNAKGNAFGPSGVTPFASGGVVSSPTMFGYGASKTGLMGEAGPEAIMPLKRTSSGDLGVQATTAPVYVNIINNSNGTEVTQKESTGPNGERMLEIAVNNIVNRGMRSGTYDTTMQSAFNLRRRGN